MKFNKNSSTILGIASLLLILIANSYLIHFLKLDFFTDFPIDISKHLEKSIDNSIEWTVLNYGWFFDYISDNLKYLLGKMRTFLVWVPWPITMVSIFLLAWKIASYKVGIMCVIGLALLAIVNLWEPTMVTVAIMIVAVLISILVGIPLGVLGSKNQIADTVMRPILDAMQTMPSFVYLVPGIMLFGLGNVAAILATVLYAIPPCIRLTNLGIRQVDESVVEAGKSFGSNNMQLLLKIQIPMAIPTIMAGINQTVMMALAMSTIAAMVGAGGLGTEVLRAMGQLREGEAVIAGFAIVILAIIIDRISQGYIDKRTI